MSMRLKIFAVMFGLTMVSHQALAQDAYAFFRGETFPPPRSAPAAGFTNCTRQMASSIPILRSRNFCRIQDWPGTTIPAARFCSSRMAWAITRRKVRKSRSCGWVMSSSVPRESSTGTELRSKARSRTCDQPCPKGRNGLGSGRHGRRLPKSCCRPSLCTAARKTGTATLTELLKADSTFPFNIVSATFAPGKRLDWHNDSDGQILVITDGSGYYQERGQAKQLVRKGDVVKSAAGIEHWHGAAAEIGVTYIAITSRKATE